MRVLLIGELQGNAAPVLRVLKDSRTQNFIVIHETSLADAIERIRLSAAFDVALLDINLPDSTGMGTLSSILAVAPSLPIVIITRVGDGRHSNQILHFNAPDTPITVEALDESLLPSIHYAISSKRAEIENKAMADNLAFNLAAESERINEDLALARRMQFDLLPKSEQIAGYRLSHGLAIQEYFEPSFDIGGDLWGCIGGEGGRTTVYMFDFSGHGVAAALNVFRLHALLTDGAARIVDPAASLERLNHKLYGLLPRGQFATIFLGIIDNAAGTLTWAAGGAPRPILFNGGGEAQWLDTRGKPLGISPSSKYVKHVLPFPPQSSLFLYSDIMTEARADNGEMLGEEGLLAIVGAFHKPEGIDLSKLVRRFADTVGSPMDDDMTAVCITRIDKASTAGSVATNQAATSDRTGLPADKASPAAGPPLLVARGTEAIASGLVPPYHGFLEISAVGLADVGSACLEAAELGGLCVSLTAASAWSCGLARAVSGAVRQRFAGDHDWPAIDICLGEAIGN
ncbi:MAG TPA: SpoIIE family protein phosphatase, partial [Rhodospirillaceae bacterium]|nr:SpoIIE family protein phosphatase [Rhodospirillaceae bacterium]